MSISKLTKEWLQNVISGLEDLRDPMLAFLDDDQAKTYEAMKLALEALDGKTVADHAQKELERLRAQTPVGWTDEQELRDVERGGCGYLFKADPITPHADMRRVILLYAEPKPLAVPEKPLPDTSRMHAIDAAIAIARVQSWNECRAAMLQSLGSSPVVPDGWVPCSERMPEESVDADGNATGYLVLYEKGKEPNGGFNIGVWNVTYLRQWWKGIVTHWMVVPAAPEVK